MPDNVELRRIGAKQPVIVVAERELLLRFQMAEFLRAAGYRVIEVGDVVKAEGVFGAGVPVDLVFCDIHVAGGDNDVDALQRLSGHHPGVRAMVTSPCNVAAAARALAIEFIPKPYRLSELALRLGSLLKDDSKTIAAPGERSQPLQSLQPA
jgi:DNA-binding NtrC family response regulator